MEQIKNLRLSQGLSQQALASKAGVSLPTLQNIEAGKANPTIEVINKLLSALGAEIKISLKKPDIDILAAMGLPITSSKKPRFRSTLELLKQQIFAFAAQDSSQIAEREREAFQALLMALALHYPDLYKKNFKKSSADAFLPLKPTGRHIKLYRIAKAKIAEYL